MPTISGAHVILGPVIFSNGAIFGSPRMLGLAHAMWVGAHAELRGAHAGSRWGPTDFGGAYDWAHVIGNISGGGLRIFGTHEL